ncbi:hypothetical protein DLJ49_11250 [Rhodovulum sp. 12E13]|uniref:hypothetical protein n=1 Tax=Rhodovulum sp. 12E13 TaxID=2203891 RepID=UPI000E168779|nr:hypothetical protein [Rhodovulum sp. 12E13]RDC72207.1 hypothetical protein DLJ49_11250 [Rhodovulum sp. 12E13]
MARMLTQAALTGAFCLVFALAVDTVTDTLSVGAFLAVSFASGFLGSLFAQTALRRGRPVAGEAE